MGFKFLFKDSDNLMSLGNLFHKLGPAIETERSP